MTLTSNNPRITEVELTGNNDYLTYYVDGKFVETWGDFDFIFTNYNCIGIRESAIIRDPEDEDTVLEEINFEAYFDK